MYESSPPTAHKLLQRPLKSWGNRTLMAIADTAEQMEFMQHECCQTKINKNWFGNIATHTPTLQVNLTEFETLQSLFTV